MTAVVFSPPKGQDWWGIDATKVVEILKKISPLRKVYRNGERTRLYITGTADEVVTTSVLDAFPGSTWVLETDQAVLKAVMPGEFRQ